MKIRIHHASVLSANTYLLIAPKSRMGYFAKLCDGQSPCFYMDYSEKVMVDKSQTRQTQDALVRCLVMNPTPGSDPAPIVGERPEYPKSHGLIWRLLYAQKSTNPNGLTRLSYFNENFHQNAPDKVDLTYHWVKQQSYLTVDGNEAPGTGRFRNAPHLNAGNQITNPLPWLNRWTDSMCMGVTVYGNCAGYRMRWREARLENAYQSNDGKRMRVTLGQNEDDGYAFENLYNKTKGPEVVVPGQTLSTTPIGILCAAICDSIGRVVRERASRGAPNSGEISVDPIPLALNKTWFRLGVAINERSVSLGNKVYKCPTNPEITLSGYYHTGNPRTGVTDILSTESGVFTIQKDVNWLEQMHCFNIIFKPFSIGSLWSWWNADSDEEGYYFAHALISGLATAGLGWFGGPVGYAIAAGVAAIGTLIYYVTGVFAAERATLHLMVNQPYSGGDTWRS